MSLYNSRSLPPSPRAGAGATPMSISSLGLPITTGVTAHLDHLGLIRVEGSDAAAFLHAQLTNDALDLAPGEARLSGYCSPKGRLLAIALFWQSGDAYLLLVGRDLLAPLVKRLAMFVLRSKVTITDVTAEHWILGCAGEEARGLLAAQVEPLPGVPFGAAVDAGFSLVSVPPAVGLARWIALVPRADHERFERVTAGHALSDGSVWRWLDIRAGLPVITVATQDKFVPQMINLEALGGVDFKKGCFPGQEVVARSQYLGKLKRRMTGAHLEAAAALPAFGADVLVRGSGPGAAEPVGSVVAAEFAPDGGTDLLIEVPLAAMAEPLLLASSEVPLALWPVPYPLPENDVFVRPRL